MKNRWLPLVMMVASFVPTLALAQNTGKGAAIGGVAGALAGAAIGKHNGETGAGALIGGAVGLVTGAAIGNAQDQEIARQHAYQQQYQQQVYAQQAYAQQQAVSMQDVVVMVQNGLSDQVIISTIQQRGVQKRPEVSEIIALHQQGVSEPVINCMQRAPIAGAVLTPVATPAPVVVQPQPVIVEQYHYGHPYYYSRPYYYPHHHHHHHHHGHHHHGSGVSWGVSVHGH